MVSEKPLNSVLSYRLMGLAVPSERHRDEVAHLGAEIDMVGLDAKLGDGFFDQRVVHARATESYPLVVHRIHEHLDAIGADSDYRRRLSFHAGDTVVISAFEFNFSQANLETAPGCTVGNPSRRARSPWRLLQCASMGVLIAGISHYVASICRALTRHQKAKAFRILLGTEKSTLRGSGRTGKKEKGI